MGKFDALIDNKIAQNIFIWLFFFLVLITTITNGNKALVASSAMLLLAPAIYINNLLILPYFRKNRILFFLYFIINAIAFAIISVFLIQQFSDQDYQFKMFVNFFGIMILALVFGTAIKLSKDSFVRRQQEKEAELKLLKAQLNPHFLFNTLNNLYGLSVIKSDKLPNLMLKLSDLLRYSLYETSSVLVPLDKEIKYLENYISLEKIRLEDKTDINFEVSGNVSSIKIAPMLFIVFVENAFKHLGVLTDEKSSVSVKISQNNGKLHFTCENTLDETETQNHELEKGKSGIGLLNAKKRLSLLYADKHQLEIEKNKDLYCVNLKLY
ncbi:MAG: sensor histidine kinase [Polaribacter sp.]